MSDDRFTPEQQAIDEAALLRCEVTGNPCGTDTWGNANGGEPIPCRCEPCQRWLLVARPGATACRRYIDNPVTADEIERFAEELRGPGRSE